MRSSRRPRAGEERVLGRNAQVAKAFEVDAVGGVAEERRERLARRAARDELGDDHLGGLLHRGEPEERDQPVDGEDRLGREHLDAPPEQPEDGRRAALRGSGVEPVAVGLEPGSRVGRELPHLRIEIVHEPERTHRAIDGPRKPLLPEHGEQLPARRREHEVNLHEPIRRVQIPASPGGLREIASVNGRVSQGIALDRDRTPRPCDLHGVV